MDDWNDYVKGYYTLRGWTLEDHPMNGKLAKEINRWKESLTKPVKITDGEKACPSC